MNPKDYSKDFVIRKEREEYVIKEYVGSGEEILIIPEGVTRISKYAFDKNNCRKIKKIIFPKTLKRIPDSNFDYWINLEEVTIPEGIKIIGERAFAGTGIRSVTLPSSIDKIEKGAFLGCDKLHKITINHISESILNGLMNFDYLNAIGKGKWELAFKLFFGASEDIEFTEFFKYYHYNGEVLKFSLSNWFVMYGNYIIGYVGKEKNLRLPECAIGIAKEAFAGKQGIQSITFTDNIKFVGEHAFDGCKTLRAITLSDSIVAIGDYAFADTGIEKIEIPACIEHVGDCVFAECKRLKNIVIMKKVFEKNYGEDNWSCYWRNGSGCEVKYAYTHV